MSLKLLRGFFRHNMTVASRRVMLLSTGLLLAFACIPDSAGIYYNSFGAATRNTLLELFTSEGCSSCPAADELLSGFRRSNVYVLEFHVDYWDRLGWKDPFSSSLFSDRQRDYARRFSLRSVYTPQLIVNGTAEFVGSDRARITDAIERAVPGTAALLQIHARTKGRQVTVSYNAEAGPENKRSDDVVVCLALVQLEAVSKIGAGENSGRILKHINIVRDLRMEQAGSGTAVFDLPVGLSAEETGITGWIQEKGSGRVETVSVSGTEK